LPFILTGEDGIPGMMILKAQRWQRPLDILLCQRGDAGVRVHWSGAHSFSVLKSSKHKAAAVSLIKFITSEAAGKFEAELGFGAVRKSVWDYVLETTRDKRKFNFYKTYKYALENDEIVTPPLIPEWPSISNILYPQLQAAILGEKPVKKALDDAARKVEELMAKDGYYR